MPTRKQRASLIGLFLVWVIPNAFGQKPPLTLDDFFESVEIRSVRISPDGQNVVIEAVRPDWSSNYFRDELWIYRDMRGGSLTKLTDSGQDRGPQWSPDSRRIAFLSRRPLPPSMSSENGAAKADHSSTQVYAMSVDSQVASAVTFGDEEVHAFAWSADSRRIFFAMSDPWPKAQRDAYLEAWKDVIQFREDGRRDMVFVVDSAAVVAKDPTQNGAPTVGGQPRKLIGGPYRIQQMSASPDGRFLAIATTSLLDREESDREPYGIYTLDLATQKLHLAVHTQAPVDEIHWSPDSQQIYFAYEGGTPEGPFQSVQTRLYSVAAAGGTAVRWASGFVGSIDSYAVTQNGGILAAGRLGTEVQPYVAANPAAEMLQKPGWRGTYEMLSSALHSSHVAFVHSSLMRPAEVFLADSPERFQHAQRITNFNQVLADRDLPQGRPYRWTADDGTTVEGMLVYPPGKFEAKQLPTLTLIHGGPQEGDRNHFEADWYQWSALAATHGWLVFQPNYRGSLGYGDEFTLGIVGSVNARPGKDILEGLDALVKDGIADPKRLTVGGYSSGGDLTNWLITQTNRFNAAVTGAGCVEYVVQWGNEHGAFYDAFVLRGLPWEVEANYNTEAAIWKIGNVTTPTHIVAGSEDDNVHVGESYLLERALTTRGIPSKLLIFPGEGHELDKNPWHGKIKVREELKWLEKYGNLTHANQ